MEFSDNGQFEKLRRILVPSYRTYFGVYEITSFGIILPSKKRDTGSFAIFPSFSLGGILQLITDFGFCSCRRKIEVSSLFVCPLIDHELQYDNIVKVTVYTPGVTNSIRQW